MGSREDEQPRKKKLVQSHLPFQRQQYPYRVTSLEETCEEVDESIAQLREHVEALEALKALRSEKENKPTSRRRDEPTSIPIRRDKRKADSRDRDHEQTTQEPKRFKQSTLNGDFQVRVMVTLLGSTLIE